MPRSPRLAFQNTFYHVFNRGINKQPIFLSDDDYKFFLSKLSHLKDKYDHSIYAYCVMPNHFHLSIQTRKMPISKIMSSLTTSYSMYFNKKYKHFGPVFQNRFKSLLIQNDSYFFQLSQYIYLNPVKDRLVNNPVEYPYSGLQEALGKTPLFILDSDITRLIGETPQSIKSYKEFIYSGLSDQKTETIERLFENESILGSNNFNTSVQKRYLKRLL